MSTKSLLITTLITASLALSNTALAKKDDAGEGHDYRTFHSNGKIDYGNIADSYKADLVMYLAGNQFMAMKEVITDFQNKNPDKTVSWTSSVDDFACVFRSRLARCASVNLGHLKKLKGKSMMNDYIIYTHNKLELMVAKGNPKNIKGPKDLGRDDLVQSHPNPLTEGIFKFYGAQMLKDLGLHQKVTAGKKCKSCWAVDGKTWFTSRHHRETPHRIENGQADTGIVWTTEVKHAQKEGRKIEGVSIPAPYNMGHKVGYAIGVLKKSRNPYNAARYLSYLGTADAQAIYAKYGFVSASTEDLKLKPIP